jgi:hypothetical protein
MFKKIKEFFTGSKPVVETPQEVPLTAVDAAVKNIKETTVAVDAKVEVGPVATPVAVKEQAWTKKSAPPVAKTAKPKQQQSTKAPATTAPKKRKPTVK